MYKIKRDILLEFLSYLRTIVKVFIFFIIPIRLLNILWFSSYVEDIQNYLNIFLLIILGILVFIPDKIITKYFYYFIVFLGITDVGLLIKILLDNGKNPLFVIVIGISIVILFITYIFGLKDAKK